MNDVMRSTSDLRLAVIGLGYVGLPLAVEFAKARPVFGFDINERRIAELRAGVDVTRELSKEELAEGKHLQFTTRPADIAEILVGGAGRADAKGASQQQAGQKGVEERFGFHCACLV